MVNGIYVDVILISAIVNIYLVFGILFFLRKRIFEKRPDIGFVGLLGLKRIVERGRKKLI